MWAQPPRLVCLLLCCLATTVSHGDRLIDTLIRTGELEPIEALLFDSPAPYPAETVARALTRQTAGGLDGEIRELLLYRYLQQYLPPGPAASGHPAPAAPSIKDALLLLFDRWRLLESGRLRARVIRLAAVELVSENSTATQPDSGTPTGNLLHEALSNAVSDSARSLRDGLRDETQEVRADALVELFAICEVTSLIGTPILGELLREIAARSRNRDAVDAARAGARVALGID